MANNKQGKSIEQVMEDLNQMLGSFGKGSRKGNSSNGGSSGGDRNDRKPEATRGRLALLGGAALIYGLYTSFYKIEQSQEGVVTRFGAFYEISGPGPHLMLPFGIDSVYKIQVTRVLELQFGFRQDTNLSEQQTRLESLMLTGDLNVAEVEWILKYRIADAKKYLFKAVNVEKNIRDVSISVMRRVVGDKLVSDVLTKDRVSIATQARDLTQEVLDRFDMGILVTTIALQNVTPPESVKPAFNEVNIARQEMEQMINEAQGVYNKVIPEAEGKASKIIAEAEAFAIDQVNRAKGDADKFREVLVAYRAAPEITRKRMYLETMAKIFKGGKLTVVDSEIKGLLPIFKDPSRALSAPAKEKEAEPNS